MLSVWNPWIENLSKKITSNDPYESLFDGFFGTLGVLSQIQADNSLLISVDLPGVSEENISVEISPDNILSIKAERKTKISSFSYNKSFTLPEGFDTNNVSAELSNGVLSLTMPRLEEPAKESKKILVAKK